MKKCIVCKENFSHGTAKKKICSVECKKIHTKKYKKKFNKNKIMNCVVCNKEFVKRNTSITCSKTCSKERGRIRNAKWRKENAKTLAIKKSEYQKNNRKILNESKKRWFNKPKNKLNHSVQMAVLSALKKNHNPSILKKLDFTIEELRTHLENQFENWMNWDNHGLWHIDHIKPVASFDFTSMEDEDFKKCWALENLQPLKDTENMRKNHYYLKAKEME